MIKERYPNIDQDSVVNSAKMMECGYNIAILNIKTEKKEGLLFSLVVYLTEIVMSFVFGLLFFILLQAPVWASCLSGIVITCIGFQVPIYQNNHKEGLGK